MTGFFQQRFYKINKILLSAIGQWPFRSANINRQILIVTVFIAGTQFIAKILGLISVLNDVNLVFECLAPIITDLAAVIKTVNYVLKTEQMKVLFNRIEKDVNALTTRSEIILLNMYSEKGRRYTIMYAGALFSAMVLFMILPVVPLFIGKQANNTERPLIHIVNYWFDPQNHYYAILFHAEFTILICITTVVAQNTTFIIFVQHVCGLFCIVGYRLDHITEGSDLSIKLQPVLSDDKTYDNVRHSIYMHNKAIKFAELIEEFYSMSFFFEMGLNMLSISLTGLQAVSNLDNKHELVRQVAFQIAVLTHLYLESIQGQQLLDHSVRLQENLINTKWYRTSFRTRKLLSFMIMRTQTPSLLTAGKMVAISKETFSTIVRTSMSYFTLLRSLQ